VDFNEFKKYIRHRLDQWDEIILLPQRHPDMKITGRPPSLEVNFRDRFYVFPKNEVCLLPVFNTSVEELARLLAEDFFQAFKKHACAGLKVSVEETRGQSATFHLGEKF
jgi:6-pyruvoyltetrahydropterin/6-carboxytetrahydropterin synthase